jgi:hypothetical protein
MPQQTPKAAKDRSEKAIARLRQWAFHLDQEMRPHRSSESKYRDPEILTLKWIDIETLIADLRKCANDLQIHSKRRLG